MQLTLAGKGVVHYYFFFAHNGPGRHETRVDVYWTDAVSQEQRSALAGGALQLDHGAAGEVDHVGRACRKQLLDGVENGSVHTVAQADKAKDARSQWSVVQCAAKAQWAVAIEGEELSRGTKRIERIRIERLYGTWATLMLLGNHRVQGPCVCVRDVSMFFKG